MSHYAGMHRTTGHSLDGLAHIRQSIIDILTTSLGTRLMRRTYGSVIPSLIDQPISPAIRMRLISGAVMAVLTWEPRIKITRCLIRQGDQPHSLILVMEATRTDGVYSGQRVSLSVPIKGGTA